MFRDGEGVRPMIAVRRRDEVLAFVVAEIVRTGASPTIQEIADALKVSKPRVRELLAQLVLDGVVHVIRGTQRGIRVIDMSETRRSLVDACRRLGWVTPDQIDPFPQEKLSRLPPIRYLPPDDQEAA